MLMVVKAEHTTMSHKIKAAVPRNCYVIKHLKAVATRVGLEPGFSVLSGIDCSVLRKAGRIRVHQLVNSP
jgi:hypothetical protein